MQQINSGKPGKYRSPAYRRRMFWNRVKIVLTMTLFVCLLSGGIMWGISRIMPASGTKNKQQDVTVDLNQNAPSKPMYESSFESSGQALPAQQMDFTEWNKTCDFNLLVVNHENKIPEGYAYIDGDCRGIPVDKRMADHLEEMIVAARDAGHALWISSGYRSMETQERLFREEVDGYKSQGYSPSEASSLAGQAVAIPGTSEHTTGLSVDLNGVKPSFADTEEYQWLIRHAAEYGFILRYPKDKQDVTGIIYEPWHFRYVGKEDAEKIAAEGLCLEEYVQKLISNQND